MKQPSHIARVFGHNERSSPNRVFFFFQTKEKLLLTKRSYVSSLRAGTKTDTHCHKQVEKNIRVTSQKKFWM